MPKSPQIIVEELIEGCTDSTLIPDLLRKALVLAHLIKSTELSEWAGYELNGYPEGTEVPTYRTINGNLVADMQNMAYRFNNQPISATTFEKAVGKKSSKSMLVQTLMSPISEISEIAISDGESLERQFPIEIAARITPHLSGGYWCTGLSIQYTKRQFSSIIDQLKTRLLAYALQISTLLEESQAKVGKVSKDVPTEALARVFENAILGGSVVLKSS